MEQKIIGIDLGTNSLGIAIRNTDLGDSIAKQLEYYSSIIFPSGVGKGQSGEYSYAAERTKYRSARRLYQSRKYRMWATLRLLIAHGCCPLKEEELDQWARYDKSKGLKRQYPINAELFEQWVRLDFDCDGQPEYSSPYQLRAELMERTLDWNNTIDRYKFGRAMYHIAQRRGFKSSKGETLKESKEGTDVDTIDISGEMKKSEEKTSQKLEAYKNEHHYPTIGCAFAQLEREGERIRNSEYKAVQSQYRQEVEQICKYQHIDELSPELYQGLISTKKGEGTIFYRRPLRSQKGSVGKCTLEPKRRRCPISHPDFEEYRALSFINNIKFRLDSDSEWRTLSDKERSELFEDRFTRASITFKFADIRKWLEKRYTSAHFDYNARTINYRDHTTVAGCPIISRLKKILGEEWRTNTIATERMRTNHHTGEVHRVSYNYADIWHFAYSADDYEELSEFAEKQIGLSKEQCEQLIRLWSAIQEGYASLSHKAISNILPFLRKGIIYSEAVAFAKIPDIIGYDHWRQHGDDIMEDLRRQMKINDHRRLVYGIANALIANYKTRVLDEQESGHNTSHIIDDKDQEDVRKCIIDTLSIRRWNNLGEEEQTNLQQEVAQLYQGFFSSSTSEYYRLPRQSDALKETLKSIFPEIDCSQWEKLYHHSQMDLFPRASAELCEIDGKKCCVFQLRKPNIGAIKNPVALRALHVLRHTINELLRQGMINEDTRVVVETARDMNDGNWRKAIELYQKVREKENETIIGIIKEFRPNYSEADIEKGRLLFEQNIVTQSKRTDKEKAEKFALDMQKYKLWKEQKFQCLYTGKYISLANLFDEGVVDIEHTIPRSISFDDSLKNRTVCDAHFNRTQKGNRIPSELPNYEEIKERIKPWEDTVVHIKSQIELWKGKAKTAATIERKNECIQQRHLWELELDYWQSKLRTFHVQKEDLDIGFRNGQLVDTRIITKYAFHYLKSVFTRVDVQKGNITANFRKILGIQSVDEKKDREKHSHHAVDAAVLTMIPPAAQRDRMMELFYQLQEANDMDKGAIQLKMKKELASCRLGTITGLVDAIEQNILVNHVVKDQTLTPARKSRRIGKHKVQGQWLQGDSIRGSLHQDTFYGAIKSPSGDIIMVVRKPLESFGTKNNRPITEYEEGCFDSIIDPAVRRAMEKQIQEYMNTEGLTFAQALKKPIYMLSKDDEPIKQDKNGHPIAPIRHVRCRAKAGRGYIGKDTVLSVKEQTYHSKKDYKNVYYAQTDDNYLCLLYEGVSEGKTKQAFRMVNHFDIAQLRIKTTDALFTIKEFSEYNNNPQLHLKAVIKKGTRVIFYKSNPEEVYDMDPMDLSKRLYVVRKFNEAPTAYIYSYRHIEARDEKKMDASEKGKEYSSQPIPSFIKCTANNFKALIEHYDFEVDASGSIHFTCQ